MMYPRSTKTKAPKPEPPQLTAAELDLLMRQFIGGGSIERNTKRAKKEEQEKEKKERQKQRDLPQRDERRRRRSRFGSLDTKPRISPTTITTSNNTSIVLPTLSANAHPSAYPYPKSQSPAHPYSENHHSSGQTPVSGSMPESSWYSSSYYDLREFTGIPEQGWVTYDPFAASSTSASASSSPISITSTIPLPPYHPSPPSSPSISISPYDLYIPPVSTLPEKPQTRSQTQTQTRKEKPEKQAISSGFTRFRGRAKSLFGFGGH